MKKIVQFCTAVAVMFAVAGCYNDFDTPKPAKVYTDADFAGLEHKTIAQVKQLFLDEHKTLSGTGENSGWNNTKYTLIEGDYYIKGKIQSSDEEGNIYKSLHLVDETGAIEIKLGTGLYIDFPMGRFDKTTGTIPTNWVYVKISGLYVGNYRMMLSIGKGPTDSYNKVGDHKFYANSNMENPLEIKERVFLGEPAELKLGEEILEVNSTNYAQFFGEANQDKLGRMVILRGVTCRYGSVGSNLYPSWMCTDVVTGSGGRESKLWYKWAVNEDFYSSSSDKNIHCNFYGSVLFTYGSSLPSQTLTAGVYTVRTSGYSRFAKQPIVRDGATGDILAIIGIYSKSWTYGFGAYQCSVNNFDDIMFDESAFLSEEEVNELTPDGKDEQGGYDPEKDSRATALSNSDYED